MNSAPTGVPKTGFMIESMVTATAINIALSNVALAQTGL